MKLLFSYERQILCEKRIQIYGLYKIIDILFFFGNSLFHLMLPSDGPSSKEAEAGTKAGAKEGALLSKAFVQDSGPFA